MLQFLPFYPNLMTISPPPGTRFISDCSDSHYCYDSPAPISPPSYSPSPSYYPPPPLPPPTTTHDSSISKVLQKSSKNLTLIVVLFLCALAMAFLFLSYLIVRKQRNSRARGRNSGSRRRGRAAMTTRNDDTGNPVDLDLDLLDDNHGQVVDHPIWYIRTVGLQKSVIESIAVFKYKRDESLIEGSDCSVCLSEFEEDETLRLLPKCSHAFHIHCIDTWLSSHQNCPLCRAPIVSTLSATDLPVSTVIAISDQAQSDNSTAVDPDPESLMNSQSQRLDHVFPDEVNLRLAVDQSSVDEDDPDTFSSGGRNTRSRQSRVLSDLSHHRRSILKEDDEEEGSEGMGRRSVSLDASSAANLTSIFLSIAKTDVEACSSNEPAPTMKNNKSITSRVTKTYSLGRFLQRGGPPVHTTHLKRSTSASSSGGFFSLSSRH